MADNRTEILSIRMTPTEKRNLAAGAASVGMSLSRFVIEVLMESLAVPSEKTALLEAVLQQGYIQREIAKFQGVDERTIEKLEAKARSISDALRGQFAVSRGIHQ